MNVDDAREHRGIVVSTQWTAPLHGNMSLSLSVTLSVTSPLVSLHRERWLPGALRPLARTNPAGGHSSLGPIVMSL